MIKLLKAAIKKREENIEHYQSEVKKNNNPQIREALIRNQAQLDILLAVLNAARGNDTELRLYG